MASSTPSLSKTSNPPLSSSTRLIPHQPQFMQETGTQHQHHRSSPYEKKLVKIQNTQFIGENLMPINFSSSSSSTNSELEMSKILLEGQRNRRKSSRILRGLSPAPTNTSVSMSYPALSSETAALPTTGSGSGSIVLHPTITNSNYHLKWNDHVNSTVSAIQCLLANETFVDVTLVCDENIGNENNSHKNKSEKNMINGSYNNNNRKIASRHRRFQQKEDLDEDDEEANFGDEDDEDDLEEGELWNHTTPRKSNHYQIKLKAHKIILSTCSEYFRKIFSENPCKHPVIVLKDFQEWEVRSLLDFMYKGQINVRPDRLDTLMKAADALQIRGLRECIEKSEEWAKMRETGREQRMIEGGSDNEVESLEAKTRVLNRTSDNNTKLLIPTSISISNSSSHPHSRKQSLGVDNESGPSSPKLLNLSMSGGESMMMMRTSPPHLTIHPMEGTDGPQTSIVHQTAPTPTRLNNNHHHQTNQSASSPPFPRRKQARPRRRSGDFVAQDLRVMVTPPPTIAGAMEMPPTSQELAALHDFHIHHNNNKIHDFPLLGGNGKGGFDRPPHLNHLISNHFLKNWAISGNGSPMRTPPHPHSSPVKHELDSDEETPSPTDRFRSPPGTPGSSPSPIFEAKQFGREGTPLYNDPISGLTFKTSPPSPSFFMNLNNGHPLLSGGHHSDSESNNPELASTPPSVFSPAGFPHNGGGGGNHHNNSSSPHHGQQWPGLPMGPAPIFGRHRAQHSAPRGGPPRAWSNADLTEALHNVWNKKMTTSQASRIFGIPYNSLLMYVRGKYGKSLKLDLLKKGLDLALENSNNGGAANSLNSNGGPPQPSTIPGLSSTLISNNNNNNNRTTPPSSQSQKSKSRSHYSNSTTAAPEDSPPSGLTLTHSHSGNLGHNGNSSGDRTDPQDIIPPGFNPFSAVSSIFGDYPPPFPFPPSALSHILPPVNHLPMDKITLTRRNDGDK